MSSIQDEANKKLIAISVEASKLSLTTFSKMINFLLVNIPKVPKLKTQQSLKTLVKSNPSIKKIDIEDINLSKEDLKIFKDIARKTGLKYALIHNPENNKITFFFNSGKAEVYEQVYNELRKKLENPRENTKTLVEKIQEKKQIILENEKIKALQDKISKGFLNK